MQRIGCNANVLEAAEHVFDDDVSRPLGPEAHFDVLDGSSVQVLDVTFNCEKLCACLGPPLLREDVWWTNQLKEELGLRCIGDWMNERITWVHLYNLFDGLLLLL